VHVLITYELEADLIYRQESDGELGARVVVSVDAQSDVQGEEVSN
jgi:hypothetical protein